jgi:selenocysteine lyase/cysteine desulfurase
VGVTARGELDEEDFDRQLSRYAGEVALVAITGASNVTGFLTPIHRLAEKAHAAGAQIAVDCAQLAPHRAIRMGALDDPAHLDYVFLSAHKLYAPYGSGALVGRKDTFEQGDPDLRGGGEVEIVTLDDVHWSSPPERDEAGSPNVVGAVAFGSAVKTLQRLGMQAIAEHEAMLTGYTLARLAEVPGIEIYGDPDPARADQRLGVIPFNIKGLSHFQVAAILGYEFGIGVRNGCFCAHPYLLHLMGVEPHHAQEVRQAILDGDRREVPGMIRISFGLYNQKADVDAVVEALKCIVRGEFKGVYTQDLASGEYHPAGWQVNLNEYFSL